MAKLLDDNNIKYTANRSFKTVNKKGYRNHREVDFCLHEDLSVLRREHPIRYIEVKSGKLDRDQQEDLRNAGIYTDIIIPLDIIYWEIHGLSLQK
ncbi:MAG: hypothetical protein Q7S19_03240 [bacterium]|nr:hypothetical protein [bacterium]